jgi:hypothetical protein
MIHILAPCHFQKAVFIRRRVLPSLTARFVPTGRTAGRGVADRVRLSHSETATATREKTPTETHAFRKTFISYFRGFDS